MVMIYESKVMNERANKREGKLPLPLSYSTHAACMPDSLLPSPFYNACHAGYVLTSPEYEYELVISAESCLLNQLRLIETR